VTLALGDYMRWQEPDPRDLIRPYAAELMRMEPTSTRVNKPDNDDASIVGPRWKPPRRREARRTVANQKSKMIQTEEPKFLPTWAHETWPRSARPDRGFCRAE
jgi:hypothetical protein